MYHLNMKTLILAAVVSWAFSGCALEIEVDPAKVVEAPTGAGEAIQAVADTYGMRSLPTVYWYGKGLDCMDGLGYHDQTGDCVTGDELNGVITVALPDGVLISALRDDWGCALLTHEMAHAASEQAGEGGCSNHDCRWFKGPCQGATALLEEMGI